MIFRSIIAVLVFATFASAQDDAIKVKLDAAKEKYVAEMNEYKANMGKVFDAREKAARDKGDKKAVDLVKLERTAFLEMGTQPKYALENLKRVPITASMALEAAFKVAISEYTKAKKDDEADAVEKDLMLLKAGKLDLAGNKPVPTPEPNKTITPKVVVGGKFKPGEEREIELAKGVKMVFCWIPAGECQLGLTEELRQHLLKHLKKDINDNTLLLKETEVSRGKYKSAGFWMGKYHVTQQEYEALIGKNPSRFTSDKEIRLKDLNTPRFPVDNVTWIAAQDYIKLLNSKVGIAKNLELRGRFALPNDNQWEYAYQGGLGNATLFYWGNELNADKANCNGGHPIGMMRGIYRGTSTEVGFFAKVAPHPWGLCDMSGNLLQWCENSPEEDSKARHVRGGAWQLHADQCRGSERAFRASNHGSDKTGFRVCFVAQ